MTELKDVMEIIRDISYKYNISEVDRVTLERKIKALVKNEKIKAVRNSRPCPIEQIEGEKTW